jgi:hypothetical protein
MYPPSTNLYDVKLIQPFLLTIPLKSSIILAKINI